MALLSFAAFMACGQCGMPFNKRACGIAHAIIASDPLRHRLLEPFVAAHDEQIRAEERERLAKRLNRWVGHYRDDRRSIYYEHAARIIGEPDHLIGPSERLAGEGA